MILEMKHVSSGSYSRVLVEKKEIQNIVTENADAIKRRKLFKSIFFIIFFLLIFTLILTVSNKISLRNSHPEISNQTENRLNKIDNQTQKLKKKRKQISTILPTPLTQFHLSSDYNNNIVLPLLVIACNRPSVKRCLDQLIKYRSHFINSTQLNYNPFPIYVSQDCQHTKTSNIIDSYVKEGSVQEHWHQPDQSNIDKGRWSGYYKISRHYKWALDKMFVQKKFSRVIIVEDDLDVAVDFYEYFLALSHLFDKDATLWCVSAWNDNGKEGIIDNSPGLLYRSDFFSGLGWMTTRDIWLELRQSWPESFWDDHLRKKAIRKDRQCIRPELSRTYTFGRQGVSNGQFFDEHLVHIKLNQQYVPFTKMNLDYLLPENYHSWWKKQVYEVAVAMKFDDYQKSPPNPLAHPIRIEYSSDSQLTVILGYFNAMDDLKDGVARTAYEGVVSLFHRSNRIFIAPPLSPPWQGYVD